MGSFLVHNTGVSGAGSLLFLPTAPELSAGATAELCFEQSHSGSTVTLPSTMEETTNCLLRKSIVSYEVAMQISPNLVTHHAVARGYLSQSLRCGHESL